MDMVASTVPVCFSMSDFIKMWNNFSNYWRRNWLDKNKRYEIDHMIIFM